MKIGTKIKYEYSKKNLFEYPEKYQKTKFFGQDFILAYEESRKETLKMIEGKNMPKNIKEIIQNIEEIKNNQNETNKNLIQILKEINSKNGNQNALNQFIKKFEISKKIFSSYDKTWKQNSTEFKNISNYILLTTICILKYQSDNNLKLINIVLKLNDLICSQIKNITTKLDLELCRFNIEKELKFVKQIQEKLSLI